MESFGRFAAEKSLPSNGSLPHNREKRITPRDHTSRGGPGILYKHNMAKVRNTRPMI